MNGTHDQVGRASHLSELRAGVRRQLTEWGVDELADEAGLVLSELVANAYCHGRPPVRIALTLQWTPGRARSVRIEVSDSGTVIDVDAVRARWRHPSFALSEGGRGLYVVDAVCRAWGDRPASRGHTVWAELPCPG
ncbi:ATP-binding protein [Streptomyces sp. DH24]|uniref:ATP-binding protein n=1 Tax=Streptomyces sp. DH24 TaxID=3040123 RepID=UPI002442C5F7|nr:ATP-binding protein [Streptomyces sp. DH24]MDG9715719.1 ATP-binding protein [Streptomyces sp. DH24]